MSQNPRGKRERMTRQWVTLALIGANLIAMNAILSPWAAARLDLTRDQSFSISPATRRMLSSLDDDLYIYGYFSKRTHPKLAPLVPQIEDLLGEYRAHARRHLHVEIIDPGDNDRIEQEANDRFGVTSTPFRLASKYESGIVNAYFAIVVKYGDQYQRYGFEDLIDVEPLPDGDVDVRLRNLEYDLTRAIKKVVFGFRGTAELFDRVGQPVKFTAVMTPDRMPAVFKDAPDAVRKAADELKAKGKERFTYEEVVPADQQQEQDVMRRFGAQPMALGLFSRETFYLAGYLTVGNQTEAVPLATGQVSSASIRADSSSRSKRPFTTTRRPFSARCPCCLNASGKTTISRLPCGSSSMNTASRRVSGLPCRASSASRPVNDARLSRRTANPSPASNGVSSPPTSWPHDRYAFSMRSESIAW